MAATRNSWQTIQAWIWLGLAVGCLFFALVFWAMNETDDDLVELEKQPETEIELQIQPEKVAAMSHLGALFDEVKPLDMTKRVAVTAQHEAEFCGTKFIQEQQKKYTIELFRVSNEDIIKSFLRKQNNRKPFIYLRLSGQQQAEQYAIFYGTYASENEAKSALEKLNLNLPKTVQVNVIRWESMMPWVNDLGTDELVNQKIYAVKLKTAAVPQIDEVELQQRRAAARAAELAQQQREAEHKQRSEPESIDSNHNNASQNSTNTVQDVIDPFN